MESPILPGWRVEESARDANKEMADAAGVSPSVFVEQLIDHAYKTRDDRGLPAWWPQANRDGELPIDSP